ncbi:MAG: FUSC family protein [Terriglobales bacterium]
MEMTLHRVSSQQAIHAVKIGVAGAASALAARRLGLSEGCWAAISAFLVMGSDVGATVLASRERLIGTVIGGALGTAVVIANGAHLLWFGVAAAATVLFCEALGLMQSYRLACVTVAIVMLVTNTDAPWKISARRFLEVALGIAVALLISALPPKAEHRRVQ